MSTHLSILNVDRISNLPDSIICNILSFLPTKLSASTSILSKRWNPLWSSLLTLHFDDTDFADFATFRHFVYSVMLTRDITLPLQYFHLKCGTSLGCDPHDINRFVCAAAQRRIQNLILELSNTNYTFLAKLGPTISGIFSSKNLVVLKLKRLVVKVLPKIDFPLLKTLHLEKVFFRRDFDKLIDGCHVLEELHIITVLCMSLKDYNGEVKHLPNLVRAKIKIFYVNFIRWNFPFAWICNATFLRLKLYSEMQEQKDYTFHNLTYLKLSSRVNLQIKCKWLVEMLEHCPKIQNLTLHQGSSCGNEIGDEDWMDPPIVPKCLSSQLRTCLFKGYKGMTCEFQLAKFILKNAKVLHTMTISASPVDINIKHQMLMKLSLCSRGSTTCKLSFE